jgi:hypothetical protein
VKATLFFLVEDKNKLDHYKRHFADASGLKIPEVGETVNTLIGDYKVTRREFEYDEMVITLALSR